MEERRLALSQKIASGHASQPKTDQWRAAANELIDQDDKEQLQRFGQRVSDVFPQADVVINARSEEAASPLLKRFFEALFGNFNVSPTKSEFFQNVAFQVSLTSCDTARQVGAAIEKNGEITATGFNEAPKAGGGTYWPDDGLDARDIKLGHDSNTVRKRQMVIDIVQRLKAAGKLIDHKWDDEDIESELLDSTDAPLKRSQIMDTMEFGRAVHAEMAALSSAVKQGLSVQNSHLHCTTFPCHNCAKHIVASGVTSVTYLEPFPKSFAHDLYPDSIEIDVEKIEPQEVSKVQFVQFVGITPNRFVDIFRKGNLKDSRGKVVAWRPSEASPILGKLDQAHIDREVLFQKEMLETMSADSAEFLGLKG